jgi:hypothetical protein
MEILKIMLKGHLIETWEQYYVYKYHKYKIVINEYINQNSVLFELALCLEDGG